MALVESKKEKSAMVLSWLAIGPTSRINMLDGCLRDETNSISGGLIGLGRKWSLGWLHSSGD